MQRNYPLPPAYVIFGKVTKSLDVVDTIAETPTKMGMDGGMSQPLTPPVIKSLAVRP